MRTWTLAPPSPARCAVAPSRWAPWRRIAPPPGAPGASLVPPRATRRSPAGIQCLASCPRWWTRSPPPPLRRWMHARYAASPSGWAPCRCILLLLGRPGSPHVLRLAPQRNPAMPHCLASDPHWMSHRHATPPLARSLCQRPRGQRRPRPGPLAHPPTLLPCTRLPVPPPAPSKGAAPLPFLSRATRPRPGPRTLLQQASPLSVLLAQRALDAPHPTAPPAPARTRARRLRRRLGSSLRMTPSGVLLAAPTTDYTTSPATSARGSTRMPW